MGRLDGILKDGLGQLQGENNDLQPDALRIRVREVWPRDLCFNAQEGERGGPPAVI